MRKIIYGIIVLIFIVGFTGCSVKSKIEKVSESKSHFEDAIYKGQNFYESNENINGEQYRVFHQASSGFTGTGSIRRSAENRAKIFCKKLGKNKKMQTISEHTAKPPYILGNFPRIEIIFACVNDKSNQNVNMQINNKYDNLSRLKILLDNGTLTKEEFEKEKRIILLKD